MFKVSRAQLMKRPGCIGWNTSCTVGDFALHLGLLFYREMGFIDFMQKNKWKQVEIAAFSVQTPYFVGMTPGPVGCTHQLQNSGACNRVSY